MRRMIPSQPGVGQGRDFAVVDAKIVLEIAQRAIGLAVVAQR